MKGSISCKYYNIFLKNCLLLQKNFKFKSPHKSRNIPAHTVLYMLSVPPPCTTNIQKQPSTLVSDAHTNRHTHTGAVKEALCCVFLLCCSSLVAAHPVGCLVIVTHVNMQSLCICEKLIDFCFDIQTHPEMSFLTGSSCHLLYLFHSKSLSSSTHVIHFHSVVFCHQLFLIETDFVPSLPLILQIQTS